MYLAFGSSVPAVFPSRQQLPFHRSPCRLPIDEAALKNSFPSSRRSSPRCRIHASLAHIPSRRSARFNFDPSLQIKVLASDLDGTLLTPKKCIDPRNTSTILLAIERGLKFIPATGKSRSGAIRAMGTLGEYLVHSSPNGFAGIFLNGLLVHGANGEVIHEQTLTDEAAQAVCVEAERRELTLLFYSGDSVLVKERTEETDMFIISHEPVPTAVGSLPALVGNTVLHKALLVSPDGNVVAHRKSLKHALSGLADITQARPDVLEIMPLDVNKGTAFAKLLAHLGVQRERSMAIGDGENDLEMISEAGLGVAMGNAIPKMKEVADVIVASNAEGGVSQAVERFFLHT